MFGVFYGLKILGGINTWHLQIGCSDDHAVLVDQGWTSTRLRNGRMLENRGLMSFSVDSLKRKPGMQDCADILGAMIRRSGFDLYSRKLIDQPGLYFQENIMQLSSSLKFMVNVRMQACHLLDPFPWIVSRRLRQDSRGARRDLSEYSFARS